MIFNTFILLETHYVSQLKIVQDLFVKFRRSKMSNTKLYTKCFMNLLKPFTIFKGMNKEV